MPQPSPVTIVNVGYRSTNYWVVSAGNSRLLVDIGWPGTLGTMKANLRKMGMPLAELRYALATHYHIDHAGLAEELKMEGVPLLVLDVQVNAIPLMKTWTKPQDRYVEITLDGNVKVSFEESRQILAEIGIPGEIVHTPGHTGHCVSLLLDSGAVFTGDLPLEAYTYGGIYLRQSCGAGILEVSSRTRRDSRLSGARTDSVFRCKFLTRCRTVTSFPESGDGI